MLVASTPAGGPGLAVERLRAPPSRADGPSSLTDRWCAHLPWPHAQVDIGHAK